MQIREKTLIHFDLRKNTDLSKHSSQVFLMFTVLSSPSIEHFHFWRSHNWRDVPAAK